jgi:predicted O-methyltransferase YrrM
VRISILKLMALFSCVATVCLLAIGWVRRDLVSSGAGLAFFLLFLVVCSLWAYRRAVMAMHRLERVVAQNDALMELVRQGALRQTRSIQALATDQAELLKLQTDGATAQQQLADRVAGIDETTRSAARQAADAQELALRAFRDVSATQKELGELLTPFISTSEKLSRHILREVLSCHAKLLPLATSVEERAALRSDLSAVQKNISKKMDSEIAALTKFMRSDKSLRTLAYRALGRMQYETVQEMEALAQLRQLFDTSQPTPLLGGFAMQPVSMLALVQEVIARKPTLMVECGSGTSTLWIARALARNGVGRLVSLEHKEEFFEKTSSVLKQHGLERWVDLRLAPLQELDINGEPFQWYDHAAVSDLQGIDILSVDGPPGFIGPLARYPALPVLREKLASDALILVDDADREDEQALMERWKSENNGIWKAWKFAGRTQALAYRSSAER